MTDGTATPEKKKCFVISPIGAKDSTERKAADQVLKHLIRKALDKQYDVERADDSSNPGAITTAMVASILEADLIVADLSGHNPNVFYELAMAHGYNKPTVHIQRAGEKVPFDVKDMRVITYEIGDPDELEAAQRTLRDFAKYVVEHPDKAETPLSNANAFAAIQESTDPAVESNVLVLDEIRRVRADIRALAVLTGDSGAVGSEGETIKDLREDLDRFYADRESAQRILEYVVRSGRAETSDFTGAITAYTSGEYDSWVIGALKDVAGSDDPDILRFAYAPGVRAVDLYGDAIPDEDSFIEAE